MSYPAPIPSAFPELTASEAPVVVHGFDPTTVGNIAARWSRHGSAMLDALAHESRAWRQAQSLDEQGDRRRLWSWYYLRLLAAELPRADVDTFEALQTCGLRFDPQTPAIGVIARGWLALFTQYRGLQREMARRVEARRAELEAPRVPNEASLWKWIHKEYQVLAGQLAEDEKTHPSSKLRRRRRDVDRLASSSQSSGAAQDLHEDRLPDFFILAEYCVITGFLAAIARKARELELTGVPPVQWAAHYFQNVQSDEKARVEAKILEAAVIYHADELWKAAERLNMLGRRLLTLTFTAEELDVVRRKFARYPGLALAEGTPSDTLRRLRRILELDTFLQKSFTDTLRLYRELTAELEGPSMTGRLRSLSSWLESQDRRSTPGFRQLLGRLLSKTRSPVHERS